MKTSILMVTFLKDYNWARYSIESVAKFCSGFESFIIVVPWQDVKVFRELAAPRGFRVSGFNERAGKGHLHHQCIILDSDIWCPNADAVLHLDADTIFWEPCTPADFFVGDKPILYRERFATLVNKTRLLWRQCIWDAVGIHAEFECMVRHNMVHLASTYAATRQMIEAHTGQNWEEWYLSGKNDFPPDRAEFPTLGAVAIERFHERYHFVDFDVPSENNGAYIYERGRDKAKAYWSHEMKPQDRAEIEAILK